MKNDALNIGMIGYAVKGRARSNAWRQVGRFFDLPAIVRLQTIFGRNASAVEDAAKRLGWERASNDWSAVVEDPDFDVIDITAPTFAERLENGKVLAAVEESSRTRQGMSVSDDQVLNPTGNLSE